MVKPQVIIGMLGTTLDSGVGAGRWEKWRPSVALGRYEDLLVDRFDLLLADRRYKALAATVAQGLMPGSPGPRPRPHDIPFAGPWDFEGVYASLHDFLRTYEFRPEEEDYYVH